jgi:hypothetical protein
MSGRQWIGCGGAGLFASCMTSARFGFSASVTDWGAPRRREGFLAHAAVTVAADETREPLGVLGGQSYVHDDAVARQEMTPRERVKATRAKARADKESAHREQMTLTVTGNLPEGVGALHVMDQAANDYDVLAALHQADLRYVIRADPTRQTTDAKLGVKEVLARQPWTVFRTVPFNPGSAQQAIKTRGLHPRADRAPGDASRALGDGDHPAEAIP